MGLPQQKKDQVGGKSMDIRNAFKSPSSTKKSCSVSASEIKVNNESHEAPLSNELSSSMEHLNGSIDVHLDEDLDSSNTHVNQELEESSSVSPMENEDTTSITILSSISRKRKASCDRTIIRKSLKLDDKIIVTDGADSKECERNTVELNTESGISPLTSQSSNVFNDNSGGEGSVDSISSSDMKDCEDNSILNQSSEEDTSKLDESVCGITDGELNSSTLNQTFESDGEAKLGVSVENTETVDVTQENQAKRTRKRMSPAEAKLKEEKRKLMMQKKQEERAAREEEKRRLKEEKQKEKLKILKERQIRKEREEFEKKERERLKQEKKEQKELEEQQKQMLKAEEKKKRDEEKAKITEEKARLSEEKARLAEEKRLAEEEKKKLQLEKERKTKEAFHSFFVKSGFSTSPLQVPIKETVFKPFQVACDMVVAPLIPSAALNRFDKQQLEDLMEKQETKVLYLKLLKSADYKSICCQKKRTNNVPSEVEENEVMIIDNSAKTVTHLQAKLFQFCENIRPAYWGTWRKKSSNIKPRNPFGRDDMFDYEVDSDEEWDEGGPGESLTGTEDEESEDDYEVDNKFFVPHGYLSPEEEGDEDAAPADPDELKNRLKLKEREFLIERQKKTIELKPIILGCFFETDVDNDMLVSDGFFRPYAAELLTTKEVPTAATVLKRPTSDSPHRNTAPVPEDAMPFLIKLLHANTNGRKFLVNEFKIFWHKRCEQLSKTEASNDVEENETLKTTDAHTPCKSSPPHSESSKISKRQLHLIIPKISIWSRNVIGSSKRFCWWVKEDVLKKYSVTDIQVPNQWNYITTKEVTVS